MNVIPENKQGNRIYIEAVIGIGIDNNGHFESDSDSEVKITGKIINAFTLRKKVQPLHTWWLNDKFATLF